jgi:hypothetical protein
MELGAGGTHVLPAASTTEDVNGKAYSVKVRLR